MAWHRITIIISIYIKIRIYLESILMREGTKHTSPSILVPKRSVFLAYFSQSRQQHHVTSQNFFVTEFISGICTLKFQTSVRMSNENYLIQISTIYFYRNLPSANIFKNLIYTEKSLYIFFIFFYLILF